MYMRSLARAGLLLLIICVSVKCSVCHGPSDVDDVLPLDVSFACSRSVPLVHYLTCKRGTHFTRSSGARGNEVL